MGRPGEANDEDTLCHDGLRQLFLSCNPIDSFEAVARNLRLPKLELLSLGECPVWSVPDLGCSAAAAASEDPEGESTPPPPPLGLVHHLNLSTTKISSWDEVGGDSDSHHFEILTQPRLSKYRETPKI